MLVRSWAQKDTEIPPEMCFTFDFVKERFVNLRNAHVLH